MIDFFNCVPLTWMSIIHIEFKNTNHKKLVQLIKFMYPLDFKIQRIDKNRMINIEPRKNLMTSLIQVRFLTLHSHVYTSKKCQIIPTK